jgi:hypothetical protein
VGLVLALSPAAGAAGGLPIGTQFHKALGEGHSLTVGVKAEGVSVTLAGVPIRCTKARSMRGEEARVGLGLAASGHPKVGQTFTLTKTMTRRGGKGGSTSASTTEVKLDFKSAQQVLVRIHQVSSTDGKTDCDGSGTYKVRRQG